MLNEVSFDIEPGQFAALVGPSGAGKTTVTYLVPRLYDPDRGRVCIDVHNVPLDSLVDAIGMATQETHLFHDTVRTNPFYATPDATEAEMVETARAANIHAFIKITY